MSTAYEPSINFTENAIRKVKTLIDEENDPNLKLRVYIMGGGCSGMQYGFDLATEAEADDFVIEKPIDDGKVVFLVNALSLPYLQNAKVDFQETIEGGQFVIENPNAKTTCGCGSSFSLPD